MKAARALGPAAAATLAFCAGIGLAQASTTAEALPDTMGMLKHAIGVHTVEGEHQVPVLAAYLADKLRAAGFAAGDIEIIPVGETAALVARYRGTGEGKPILLSGHMDVVAAKRKDWTRDPFTLIEENGYLYGRGSADMKTAVVVLVETLIRLKHEGFKPRHDLILLLSGDEETAMASTRELAKRYHDAEFLLNADAGGGTLNPTTGKPVIYRIQAAEKTYADFHISLTSAGGHSSEPNADNAIYRLARLIDRVAAYQFPPMINEITRASLHATGAHTPGPLGAAMMQFAAHPDDAAAAATISADPAYVGQIRTTCVATMLNGGHALNALPQSASLNVNCRIFPGTSVDSVRDTLIRVIDDKSATVAVLPPPPVASPASPLRKDVIAAVSDAVHHRFPGVEIVPGMSAGASDSMYFRNAGVPSYGIDAAFTKPDDTFAHGLNEKLPASEVAAGLEFWHRVLTRLAK
ncbi:M20/M25/M40 family metallo-hydrolase [Rhodanobacter ginsengisoli]|uniref:M20/M25/M40 family metallo-hydrolase n=1 Tax=Rhodanobacter ginsengisoli TaxID=418646 RepID=A0ABW0QS97_9GAMM